MKRFTVLLMILGMVSISQAVMLADFETGLDGFTAINSPAPTISRVTEPAGAITSGTHCLKIINNNSGTPQNYWQLRWTPATIPAKLGVLSFDTTMFVADFDSNRWTAFPDKIVVSINGSWNEIQLTAANWKWRDNNANPIGAAWGTWEGDGYRTCTVDLSNYSMVGATSFSMTLSLNCAYVGGIFHLDNFHFVDQPNTPNPANGGVGVIGTTLSWENSTSSLNGINVWFGIPPEPNENDPNTILSLDTYKTLLTKIYTQASPGATSSCPMPSGLINGTKYTWCVDSDPNNFPMPFWTFTATTNNPPVATIAGPADKYVYTYTDINNITITLNGSATDDGKISPLTYAWTQTAGPAATINSPTAATTTVTLTGGLATTTEEDGEAVPYVFQLAANDGQFTGSDDVTVHVNTNSCTASIEAGGNYFYGDIASATTPGTPDCKVDLYDFAELALNWLGCMDTFEGCD
jgi:hypothetical protein